MLLEWDISDEEKFDDNHIEEFLETLGDLYGYEIYKWVLEPSKDPRYDTRLKIVGYKEKGT